MNIAFDDDSLGMYFPSKERIIELNLLAISIFKVKKADIVQ